MVVSRSTPLLQILAASVFNKPLILWGHVLFTETALTHQCLKSLSSESTHNVDLEAYQYFQGFTFSHALEWPLCDPYRSNPAFFLFFMSILPSQALHKLQSGERLPWQG